MNENEHFDVAVVGAGAAGYFAAIRVAELLPSLNIGLIESSSRTLQKVRISGGGRCNVTNACSDLSEFLKAYSRGSKELRSVFSRFSAQDTQAWFRERGVALKAETDGRVFPQSDNSASIIDCLQQALDSSGVRLFRKTRLDSVLKEADAEYLLGFADGRQARTKVLLLCTGSAHSGYRLAESLGHEIVDPVPSLFTFEIDDSRIEGLQGLSVQEVNLLLKADGKAFREQGPLLVTHWGLSGPGILKLSSRAARELATVNYQAELIVSWTSASVESIEEEFKRLRCERPRKSVSAAALFDLPKRIWTQLCVAASIDEGLTWANLSRTHKTALSEQLLRASFQIKGKGVFKEEFVSCGGVSRREIDFRTMESKVMDNLYFAGEIIDIDAITGGFNFQAAWSAAWVAAECIARRYSR